MVKNLRQHQRVVHKTQGSVTSTSAEVDSLFDHVSTIQRGNQEKPRFRGVMFCNICDKVQSSAHYARHLRTVSYLVIHFTLTI